MKSYARILAFLKPYWFRIGLALIMAAMVASTDGVLAWVVKDIMDKIFIAKDRQMLVLIPPFIVGLYFVKGLGRYLQNYFMGYANARMVMDIRIAVFDKIIQMHMGFFSQERTGTIVSRIMNDVTVVRKANTDLIKNMIRQILTLIGLLFVLFKRDWQLALIALTIAPCAGVVLALIGKKLRMLTKRNQERIAILNSFLIELLTLIKVVKLFNREEYEKKRFRKVLRKLFDIQMSKLKAQQLSSPMIEFVGSIAGAFVIWIGGMKVINGVITTGEFFSFLTALMMMYGPIRKLSGVNASINSAIAASERVVAFLDLEPAVKEAEDAIDKGSFDHELRYNDVWFRYPDSDEMVLKGINLTVKKGTRVAVVGESGVGKTTLVELIPRFYDVTEGSITMDGVDIRRLSFASLMRLVGMVSQDVQLFDDTIENNIKYGVPEATREDVVRVAKMADAHDFIMRTPKGYETTIGELGTRLSGGEKQRIAIARALLKNPPILILDEATSALDAASEAAVQKALERLMEGRTVIIIAHRLSTVRNAHKIVVLEGGRIVEEGTHAQLIASDSRYKRLYNLQFAKAE